MGNDKYRAVVPDGTHLAWSRDTAGAKRALLFDDETNKLVGPPELVLDEDYSHDGATSEPETEPLTQEEIEQLLEFLAVIVIGVMALASIAHKKAGPGVSRWWNRKVWPVLQRLRTLRKPHSEEASAGDDLAAAKADLANVSRRSPEKFADLVDAAFAEYRAKMTSEEAKEQQLAVAAAQAIFAKQTRVATARRDASPDLFELLTNTVRQLEAQQVPNRVALSLESLPR